MRTYVVVRAIPPKAAGGRYDGLAEMIGSYREKLQPGLMVEGERQVTVLGVPATQLELGGSLRLPWRSPEARPVPVRGQRVFLQKDGRLYELGWLATPEAAAEVGAAFNRLLETLALVN
jgi:hypothetical protein